MDYIKPFRSDYPYFVVTPRAQRPITLDLLKVHLRLDPGNTLQDEYLNFLIDSATDYAEGYMRRVLINTEFKTFRDFFAPAIELRRTLFQSLTHFKYTVDGSQVDVDSDLYYTVLDRDYSYIALNKGSTYPTDGDNILNLIEIQFVAGYGATEAFIVSDIKLALMNHIAKLYENHGDCDTNDAMEKALPQTARAIYDKYRILELV